MRARSCLWLALVLGACGPEAPPTPDGGTDRPVILEAIVTSPAVEGTAIEIRGLGLDRLGPTPRLALDRAGAPVSVLDAAPATLGDSLFFLLSADAVAQLGPGPHTLELTATGDGRSSDPYSLTLVVASELPVGLLEAPRGEVYRNEVTVVTGEGIVTETEGDLRARFVGSFRPDAGGTSSAIDVELPVQPLERGDRGRGVLVLTTDLGGLLPGTFAGTVQLASRLTGGATSESVRLSTTLHFNPPELYSLDPTSATVGQILTIRGAGLLGGSERPDETTLIRLEGTFTPSGGESPVAFGPQELVPRWISGSEVRIVVEPAVRRDVLASELFGYAQGTFAGQATPVTIAGREELEGATTPFGFALGPVRQVVHVRFLPGFYSSLAAFGLGLAAPEVEAAIQARMEGIYAGWNVDFRFEEPDDYARTAYAVLEIGGPDPNGVGLFGYDNTPGKDVGNLRLFDAIGGTNADTQMDGYPGYGGVFVESFLFWSAHPELPGARPFGAPDPDPLFDTIFDPVRAEPATRSEARGEADAERNQAVAAAIAALGSIIGETASHELGHSLGMAQPYGSPTVYHNDFDGEGCLMDSGSSRPLGERMSQPGFASTTFCYDHPDYLDEILPR